VRQLGIQAIPGRAVCSLLSRLFHYRATRCVWVDLDNWHQTPCKAAQFEIRFLNPEESNAQARQIGVDIEGIHQATAAGVEPFGAVKGASIASCLRISPHPPGLNDDFALEFEERLVFFSKSYTLPEFRGHGWMPAVLSAALEVCAARGYRGAVACIDIANQSSWKAFRSVGFKMIATLRVAKVFGRDRIQPSRRRRRPRFRVRRIRAEKDLPCL
jgi:RimJ/RimL family protein N-acetyltransferase